MRKEKRFSKLLIRQAETLLAKDAGEERNLGSIQDKIVAQLIFFFTSVFDSLTRSVTTARHRWNHREELLVSPT